MPVPLAHAGHWLPYVVPAAVVLVAVIVATVRERRRARRGCYPSEANADTAPLIRARSARVHSLEAEDDVGGPEAGQVGRPIAVVDSSPALSASAATIIVPEPPLRLELRIRVAAGGGVVS